VRASLSAARAAWPGARLIAVFQPHLYSRTRMMAGQFGEELSAADLALVLPVYAAREEAIPGVDAELIVKGTPGHVRTAESKETEEILRQVHGNTVILFMGAGDVTKLAHRAARELEGNALGV
jgi:UDP-N-acetylmuramate--alanine ligase